MRRAASVTARPSLRGAIVEARLAVEFLESRLREAAADEKARGVATEEDGAAAWRLLEIAADNCVGALKSLLDARSSMDGAALRGWPEESGGG